MEQSNTTDFKPYISPGDTSVKEFTLRAIVLGAVFGILFGAATVYLALKAGLTVSASIPIAVLAISLGRKFLKTTILENRVVCIYIADDDCHDHLQHALVTLKQAPCCGKSAESCGAGSPR